MSATIARTIILVIALINQVLSISGHAIIPIPNEDVETLVSTGFTIVMAVINWWKNNSFTEAAKAGDELMREIKLNGKVMDR